jgi:hypothetical protein
MSSTKTQEPSGLQRVGGRLHLVEHVLLGAPLMNASARPIGCHRRPEGVMMTSAQLASSIKRNFL